MCKKSSIWSGGDEWGRPPDNPNRAYHTSTISLAPTGSSHFSFRAPEGSWGRPGGEEDLCWASLSLQWSSAPSGLRLPGCSALSLRRCPSPQSSCQWTLVSAPSLCLGFIPINNSSTAVDSGGASLSPPEPHRPIYTLQDDARAP